MVDTSKHLKDMYLLLFELNFWKQKKNLGYGESII